MRGWWGDGQGVHPNALNAYERADATTVAMREYQYPTISIFVEMASK